MNPKSNSLFHFTKSRESLKLILKNGFWPRYCLEDVAWLGYEIYDYVAYPMVCFCDIPLSRIAEHVNFYGDFGVGLSKNWAEANGLNPVLYVAGDNKVASYFREANSHADKLQGDGLVQAAKTTLRYLLAHTKPTLGTMVVDGKPVKKEFYQESEWRHVPKHDGIPRYLVRASFDDSSKLSTSNEATRLNCTLSFGPRDIKYIFVKSDTDIPDVINFIQSELDHHPNSDLKVLMSRVVSLESLGVDL